MPSFASSPWIRRCPHSGFSFARRTTKRPMPGAVGGRPGLRCLPVSYLPLTSLRCQARSVAGVTRKRRTSTSAAGAVPARQTTPVARLLPYPANMPTQRRVLVSEHEQLGILRPVSPEHQDDQAEHAARQQVNDLEQHPGSQAPLRSSCRQRVQVTCPIEYSGGTGTDTVRLASRWCPAPLSRVPRLSGPQE